MAVVFRQEGEDTYDLWVDGRIAEYDLSPDEFSDALRRRRLTFRSDPVLVEDLTGSRTVLLQR